MHFEKTYRIGRERFHHVFILLTNRIISRFYYRYLKLPLMGISLSLLPAIAIGCSDSVLPSAYLKRLNIPSSHLENGGTLDILVFNDDRLQRLDSYQRIETLEDNIVHATSTDGAKLIFLQSGAQNDRYRWAEINSYSSLRKICCSLENECRESPVMTGVARCAAGDEDIPVNLKPLACRIKLNSLKCDFSGTPYSAEELREVKAYLTYVNATCSILPESATPTRLINSGMLSSFEMRQFSDTSLICQDIADKAGKKTIHPDACFMCYPNDLESGRRTRLVIEGRLQGVLYYWSIEVGAGNGTERNRTYAYNIVIRRKGTTDPDILTEVKDIEFDITVKPWIEKEDYPVRF